MTEDTRRHPPTWLLHGGRPASRWLIRRRYDVREHGTGHVPPQGPVIVAANHTGVIDGPLLAIFGPRPVHALTKRGDVRRAGSGRFLRLDRPDPARPLRRPTSARSAPACTCSSTGERWGSSPRATAAPATSTRFRNGAAYLALVTGAPIVPLMMFGTRPAGGGKDALPEPRRRPRPGVRRAVRASTQRPWPRTSTLVAATVGGAARPDAGRPRAAGLASTGQTLPGPIPAESAEEIQ